MPRQLLNLPAPAKINLFLHVTGRRDDGYHQLQTLFQFLDYGDSLNITTLPDRSSIQLTPELPGVPPEQNIIFRAAKLLQERASITQGARIELCKRLPMGGGLGGGSSNAATALLALNQLWSINWPLTQLAKLGLQLGADVPVFIEGHSAWAEGVGEELKHIELPTPWYLIIVPECEVSTARIFNHPQLPRQSPLVTLDDYRKNRCHNDCESLVRLLYPQVDQAFKWAEGYGTTSMSGTGACLFTAFENEADARHACNALPDNLRGFIARGCNQSPTHQRLQSRHENL